MFAPRLRAEGLISGGVGGSFELLKLVTNGSNTGFVFQYFLDTESVQFVGENQPVGSLVQVEVRGAVSLVLTT